MSHKILIPLLSLIALFILFAAAMFIAEYTKKPAPVILGMSFSADHSRYLGLDPRDVFRTILDDWKFKYIRFSAQWGTLEREKGKYDFSETDYFMNEAAKRNAKVVLTVGKKTPRWPECHLPDWVDKTKVMTDYKTEFFAYIKAVVERYKNHPALEVWQVENEPFLSFGACPVLKKSELAEEVKFVKSLDSTHRTMVTDSGELSLWLYAARAGDLFGSTVYRAVWGKYIGSWTYFWLPASWYRLRLWLNGGYPARAYVVELQGEPWIENGDLFKVPVAEQIKRMNGDKLKANIAYAARTGFPRAYLWGAEWWLWMEKQGYPDLVNVAKTLNAVK